MSAAPDKFAENANQAPLSEGQAFMNLQVALEKIELAVRLIERLDVQGGLDVLKQALAINGRPWPVGARQARRLPRPSDRQEALHRAIEAAGGVGVLAKALGGISAQAVSQWTRCPSRRVIDVERATGGKVTRHELRPDIYPA